MFFLLSRYQQQQVVSNMLARGPLIADYAFAKDSLFAQLNLEGDEWSVYRRLYDVLAERIPVPNLVVYLRAETDVLMARIATRDRTYERGMDRAYIERLRQAYARYFSTYTQTSVLSIDTDDLNYVQDPSALAFVESQVRTALGIGAYQQPLPQIEPMGLVGARATAEGMTPTASEWDAVGEFLAANEAIGRVGAALAGGSVDLERQGAELGMALRDTVGRLNRLASAVGLDLREESL
jgi:hypothetical protein